MEGYCVFNDQGNNKNASDNLQNKKVCKLYLDVRDLHELDAVLLLGGERIHTVARHPRVNLKRKGF